MADASMSYLYTIGGYATLFGVGYAVYHVSSQKNKKKTGTAQVKTAKSTQVEPRKEDRKKKQRMETFAADPRPKATEPSTWLDNVVEATPDNGPDNREFARQLSKAKEGTKFTNRGDSNNQREKSVKQSRANAIGDTSSNEKPSQPVAAPAEPEIPAEIEEPITAPPAPRQAEDSAGVSDMLEPAQAGPTVLRVTDAGAKPKKQKPAKAPEPVETKKQRQNRKKAEAAKVAREEAEKDRKVLEEKQRRQARIAEGRAAKDGSQFMAANGTSSAWTQVKTNGNGNASKTADETLYQPLDTFEQPAAAPAKPATKSATKPKSQGNWVSSLPSEETQMEMLKDDSDEWSTVKTKAKKASKKTSSNGSGDEAPSALTSQARTPAPEVRKPKAAQAQNFGAFSALTNNDDSTEEAEEEWDV